MTHRAKYAEIAYHTSAKTSAPPRPPLKSHGWLFDAFGTILLVIVVYTLVELAIPRFLVDGRSMQPSFFDGQRLIVSRVNYLFGIPQRGDIIIFNSPQQPNSEPLIKRVIGLPGETVEIRHTIVFVNGVQLSETYINEPCTETNCRDNTWVLGPDEYFVMGDNRNHSNDSRRFGPIPRENIIGEALVRYWPPQDWGIVIRWRFEASE